ncbi:hypothetical protein LB535_25135 [Mesorhizobium sp. CA10]|uniref:hypothetical protein n=1 Tax=Mesorhizobium sp. CA10 TaxID=588495 RepID=UPI001CCC3590|nr:hypothetical protein [Mesorhizobium sp. CA10]MBZ9885629.1 hypothetical protein [Mesorhizobium sp. CA10]
MTARVALARQPAFGIRPFRELVGTRGQYHKSKEDYVSRFYQLVRTWRAETAYSSSSSEMFSHPAFREIVSMGRVVVPLIVQELRRQPDLLVAALPQITGDDPVSEDDRGDIYAMAASWIEWYQRRSR